MSVATSIGDADQPAARVGVVRRKQVEDGDIARRQLILAIAVVLRALWRSRIDEIGRLGPARVANANSVAARLTDHETLAINDGRALRVASLDKEHAAAESVLGWLDAAIVGSVF